MGSASLPWKIKDLKNKNKNYFVPTALKIKSLVFLVNSKEHISEIDNKDKFIFNYINENYGTIIKETSDPNWLGNTSWEADNKKFYYNKILKFNKLVVEDLLITNNEYKGYF